MKFETRTVTHVDGVTKVKAKGYIKDGHFICEYKYKGMTYGLTIPLELKKTRLDELAKGDIVLDSKGTPRAIVLIKRGMMGTNWHSINMEGTIEYITGLPHQLVKRLI